MTLILLLLALIAPSTTPTTINPHHNQEARAMAQGTGNISYPERHPNQPTPGRNMPAGTTFGRIGMDARNPSLKQSHPIAAQGQNLTPTENTGRATRR